jgi:hypothetical protein
MCCGNYPSTSVVSCRVVSISSLTTQRINNLIWPTTIHCTGNAEPSSLCLMQSLPPTLVLPPPSPAQEHRMTISRLANLGVRRRARWKIYWRRCVPCYLCLSPSTSLGDRRVFWDGVARRDQRGARRCRKRHIQSPFTIYVTCYPTPQGRVPRLRKRVQTDKSTLNPGPVLDGAPPNPIRNVTREMFRRPLTRLIY